MWSTSATRPGSGRADRAFADGLLARDGVGRNGSDRQHRRAARLVLLREAEEQRVQGRPLFVVERREEVVLDLACERAQAAAASSCLRA